MKTKIAYLALGIIIALASVFILENKSIDLISPVVAKEGPSCKVILGMSQGEGIQKFEEAIEARLQKGYKMAGFSTLKHDELGFYLQAVMTKE